MAASDRSAAWPSDRAHVGVCDVHVGEPVETLVVAWADESDAYAACKPCFTAMQEAWDELTPVEQEEAIRVD